jgi:hypothetical protein
VRASDVGEREGDPEEEEAVPTIHVARADVEQFLSRFTVTVRDGVGSSEHVVTLSGTDWDRLGRGYRTPVAARRGGDGFIIALAFGAQVDWYRNLVAAGGGTIRWRGDVYSVTAPERVDAATVLITFDPVQRLLLRIAGIDGYVQVRDAESSHA